MDFIEWVEKYKPIKNHIDPDEDIAFETYGAEFEFVLDQKPENVWTMVDGDEEEPVIVTGVHYVNRLKYYVTEVPHKFEEFEVI